jgi:hypothetical protein
MVTVSMYIKCSKNATFSSGAKLPKSQRSCRLATNRVIMNPTVAIAWRALPFEILLQAGASLSIRQYLLSLDSTADINVIATDSKTLMKLCVSIAPLKRFYNVSSSVCNSVINIIITAIMVVIS